MNHQELTTASQVLRIAKVILGELGRIESGRLPSRIFWIARIRLIRVSQRLTPLSPNKCLLKTLAYELIHLYPRKHNAIQSVRLMLADVLMFYGGFITIKKPESKQELILMGT